VTVTRVLEEADGPMLASEIHSAAEELAGQPLLRTSVKAALAAGSSGPPHRFGRVGHGVYQLAGNADASPLEPPTYQKSQTGAATPATTGGATTTQSAR
jgi:hypothetical protein